MSVGPAAVLGQTHAGARFLLAVFVKCTADVGMDTSSGQMLLLLMWAWTPVPYWGGAIASRYCLGGGSSTWFLSYWTIGRQSKRKARIPRWSLLDHRNRKIINQSAVQCLHTKAPCTPTGRVLPSFQQKAIVFVAQQKTLQGTTLCTIEVGSHSPELCKDNTSGIAKKKQHKWYEQHLNTWSLASARSDSNLSLNTDFSSKISY
jgi:hypothetical protein